MEHHIYIYGGIEWAPFDDASDWGIVTQKDVRDQMNEGKNASTYVVHINSPGGQVYEGLAIYDLLVSSGKEIHTIAEGIAASMASIIYMAGSIREQQPNASIMWHNPSQMVWGESTDLRQAADEMDRVTKLLVDIYAKSGMKKADIHAAMDAETWFSADESLTKGIATTVTEVVEGPKALHDYTNKMVAYAIANKDKIKKIYNQKTTDMSKSAFLRKLENMINPAVALTINLEDGGQIVAKTENDDIREGDEVTDGKMPLQDGEYILQDKRTVVAQGGKVAELKQPEIDGNETASIENAYKAIAFVGGQVAAMAKAMGFVEDENGEFKKEAAKAENKELKETLTAINSKINELKAENKEVIAFKKELETVTSKYSVLDNVNNSNSTPGTELTANEKLMAKIEAKKKAIRPNQSGE